MSEKNEFERRTDAALWRWANRKHTALRLIAAGAALALSGFFLGVLVCGP